MEDILRDVQAMISGNKQLRTAFRTMQAERDQLRATVSGLRRALELLLKCNALGVAIPWGRAVSALAASPDEHERRIKAEALNGMAQYLDSVAGDCNEDGHHQADLVPGLRSAANDCREAAKIVEAPNGR